MITRRRLLGLLSSTVAASVLPTAPEAGSYAITGTDHLGRRVVETVDLSDPLTVWLEGELRRMAEHNEWPTWLFQASEDRMMLAGETAARMVAEAAQKSGSSVT